MVWAISNTQQEFQDGCDDVRLLQRLGMVYGPYGSLGDNASTMDVDLSIGGKHFASHDELRRYINTERLPALPLGAAVPSDMHRLLAELFTYHPNYDEKMGGHRLLGFKVGEVDATKGRSHYAQQRMQKCFFFLRSDGLESDFSVNKCIEGLKGVSAAQLHAVDVTRALAREAWHRMEGFKHGFLEAHPDACCPYASAPRGSDDDDDDGSESGCGGDSGGDDDDDAQPKPTGVTRVARRDRKRQHRTAFTPLSQLPGGAVMAVHAYPLTLSRLIAQWVERRGGFGAIGLVPSPGGTVHKQLQDKENAAWKAWWARQRGELVVASKAGYQAHVAQQALQAAAI